MMRIAVAILMSAFAMQENAPPVPRPNLDTESKPLREFLDERADAVTNAPTSADAWGQYAIALHANEFTSEADVAYAEAQRLNRDEFRWTYFRGAMLLEIDPQRALEELNRAIRIDPRYPPAHVRRGLALKRLDQDEEASAAFRHALRLSPRYASAHLYLGQSDLAAGNVESAIKHLEIAREVLADDSAVLSALAQAYGRSGDRERARALGERAKRLTPGPVAIDPRYQEVAGMAINVNAFLLRSNAYYDAGNFDAALAELNRALEIGLDVPSIHGEMARVQHRRGEFEASVRSAQTALERGLDDAQLQLALASSLFQLGKVQEAEQALNQFLEAEPDNAQGLRLMGDIAAARRDMDEAVRYWTKALERAEDAMTKRVAARALIGAGHRELAIAELQRFATANPDDPLAWFSLGEVQEAAGDPDAALLAFNRASENASGPQAGRRAASILREQKRYLEMEQRMRDSLRRWPQDPNVINELAWTLSTCPDASVRDGHEALTHIQPLVRKTGRKNAAVLDTLAAALAEVGRFEDAVAAMDEAIALLPGNTPAVRRESFTNRREQYRARLPWRATSNGP